MTKEEFKNVYMENFKMSFVGIIYDIVKDWNVINKSPYSLSLYNSNDIDWNSKPEGSLRISNHWNFTSINEKHCLMEDETKNNKWLLCEYRNGIYHIIKDITNEWEKVIG